MDMLLATIEDDIDGQDQLSILGWLPIIDAPPHPSSPVLWLSASMFAIVLIAIVFYFFVHKPQKYIS